MTKSISADTLDAGAINVDVDREPPICPLCHHKMVPKPISNQIISHSDRVQVIYRCTNRACEEVFIANFVHKRALPPRIPKIYHLKYLAPKNPEPVIFSDIISGVSERFVLIYNQANAAGAAGLFELVGMGMRKALEFLIKDFAISQHPDDKSKIEDTGLAKVINKYMKDSNVEKCASRANWLGCDETHYIRKWEDKDITDLKKLVGLTVSWIENTIQTQQYEDEMT